MVTIANGNDGVLGPFTESNGSNGEFVLAVASVNADVVAESTFQATFGAAASSNTISVPYQASVFWDSSPYQGWPIVPFNPDPSADGSACHAFNGGENGNYTNSIVLVSDGPCDWRTRQSVLDWGHNVTTPILIYTEQYPISPFLNGSEDYTVGYLPVDQGQTIMKALRAGVQVTANFPDVADSLSFVPSTGLFDGGKPSFFSSIGPTNEAGVKPDVAAPGGDIFSTWIHDGWAVLSGTSMATPYLAGVAALYVGKYGGRKVHGAGFAKDLAMRIMASGKSLQWLGAPLDPKDYGFTAPVFQVGTGLVNASKVLNYQTSLSFAKFALNDTHNFERYHSVDITNNSPVPVTYSFSIEASGAIDTLVPPSDPAGTPNVGFYYQVFSAPYAAVPSVTFPGGKFTVNHGQTKTANINFMYPAGMKASNLPLYSGKVIITGSNGESLAVPYMGIGGDLHKNLPSVFHYGNGLPTIRSGYRQVPIQQNANWTFNVHPFSKDYPNARFLFNFDTTEFRWDIFESTWKERDWKYPPVVGRNGYVGAAALKVDQDTAIIPNTTDVAATPFPDVPRTPAGWVDWAWFGMLANGTQIQPGKYWMRIAALRPFSTNPQESDNWDVIPLVEFNAVLPSAD